VPRIIKLIATAGVALTLTMGVVWGADHFDSPLAKRDVRTDITDVYAFRSPTNAANLVVAMNVSSYVPGAVPSPLFSNEARYNFHVDNTDNGTLESNATVEVTFSGSTPQQFSVKGLGATAITGDIDEVITSGGIKVYCGPRDDPFFFDLTAYLAFVAAPYVPAAGLRAQGAGSPTDFFAARNVGAIVIELPITALTGRATANEGTIRAWTTITEPDMNSASAKVMSAFAR
jgi:hypothetical protein